MIPRPGCPLPAKQPSHKQRSTLRGATPTGYTARMRLQPVDLVDVFVYLVVLGVFTQLFPQVISESFLLALLTAILLKVVLEFVMWVKKLIVGRIRSATTPLQRVVSIVFLLLVLPGSKFLVLELVKLAFGDSVRLGGFFAVTALIFTLMLARAGVRRLLAVPAPKQATD